jgi:hypothetical protein
MKSAIVIGIALSCVVPASAGQDPGKPLPDFATLWTAVKPHLMQQYDDAELLKGYTYHRTSFVTQMGKEDAITQSSKFEYEVYYLSSGPFNKLISRNGVPLSATELKKQDDEFEKTKGKGPHRPPWKGGRRGPRSPKEQEELLSDVYNAFEFTVTGREIREGRGTIRVDFKPRLKPQLKTMAAKLFFTKAQGTAWIDEEDHVLSKIEFELVKDAKLGGGFLVNIHDGSQTIREWLKINDEVWLPARLESRFKASSFVTKGFNFRSVELFSDYKKFSVDTRISP